MKYHNQMRCLHCWKAILHCVRNVMPDQMLNLSYCFLNVLGENYHLNHHHTACIFKSIWVACATCCGANISFDAHSCGALVALTEWFKNGHNDDNDNNEISVTFKHWWWNNKSSSGKSTSLDFTPWKWTLFS